MEKCGKPPEAIFPVNKTFHDSGGLGEERGVVKAVGKSCGLGWGFRKGEDEYGEREERGREKGGKGRHNVALD